MKYGPEVQCADCGDVIQSRHVHDFVSCKCGAISIDGGGDYTRLIGHLDKVLVPFTGDRFVNEAVE